MNPSFVWLVTAGVLVFEGVQVAYEATHGGVVAHHILAMESLPAISNWWGLFLLPALTWCLARRASRRPEFAARWGWALAALLASLAYGLVFGFAFSAKVTDALFFLLLGVPLAGVFFRVYRGEYLIGFILGMSWTFGAVLPTFVALVAAAWSAALHLGLYRMFRHRNR